MNEQEYREFWISKRSNEMLFSKTQLGSTIYVFNYKIEASSICAEEKDIFHVIEHRAFQSAQDKIQQLEKQNEIYRKALEFYANKDNWFGVESHDGYFEGCCHIEYNEDMYEGIVTRYGGERARQSLKDAESIE